MAAGLVLLAAGCSGANSSPDPGPDGAPASGATSSSGKSTESTASAEPYLPVPPGVELTQPGTLLSYGEAATIAWPLSAAATTPAQVAVLQVNVKAVAERSLKDLKDWRLDGLGKVTVYYATFKLKNVGQGSVTKQDLPVWGVTDQDALTAAQRFLKPHPACPSKPLPKSLGPGNSVEICQVFLAPNEGRIHAMTFQLDEEFVPIVWDGELKPLAENPVVTPSAGASE